MDAPGIIVPERDDGGETQNALHRKSQGRGRDYRLLIAVLHESLIVDRLESQGFELQKCVIRRAVSYASQDK